MRVIKIADGESSTGAKQSTIVVGSMRENYSVGLKILTGTASVDFEGSFDGTNWDTLASAKNADEIFQVTATPYIRINITAITGTVDAFVGV